MFGDDLWGTLHSIAGEEMLNRAANPEDQHADFAEVLQERALQHYAGLFPILSGEGAEEGGAREPSDQPEPGHEGLRMFDDDYGMTGEAFRQDSQGPPPTSHPGRSWNHEFQSSIVFCFLSDGEAKTALLKYLLTPTRSSF